MIGISEESYRVLAQHGLEHCTRVMHHGAATGVIEVAFGDIVDEEFDIDAMVTPERIVEVLSDYYKGTECGELASVRFIAIEDWNER